MKFTLSALQPRRPWGSGRAISSDFALPGASGTDSSRHHRASPQVVRDRQEREVQDVLLQSLVTTPRQRASHLPLGKDALDTRTHLRSAKIERCLARRRFAAPRFEADARPHSGLPQTFPPVRVAVRRIGVDRLRGRAINQSIRRHAVVHRATGGLDGAHDRATVVDREPRRHARSPTRPLSCTEVHGWRAGSPPLGRGPRLPAGVTVDRPRLTGRRSVPSPWPRRPLPPSVPCGGRSDCRRGPRHAKKRWPA